MTRKGEQNLTDQATKIFQGPGCSVRGGECRRGGKSGYFCLKLTGSLKGETGLRITKIEFLKSAITWYKGEERE